jgi:hypothetical protein
MKDVVKESKGHNDESEYKYKCKECLESFRNIHYLNVSII